jgi:hypothetical protein
MNLLSRIRRLEALVDVPTKSSFGIVFYDASNPLGLTLAEEEAEEKGYQVVVYMPENGRENVAA